MQSSTKFYFDIGLRLQELAEERERLPYVPLSERRPIEPAAYDEENLDE